MIKRVAALIFLVILVAASLAVTSSANAAAPKKIPSTGGITVSPALSEIVLASGQPEATYDFTVTNNTNKSYEFGLSIVDFGSLDESGGVLFVGRADKTLNYKYGLSNWATFGQDRVVVEPKSSRKVPVTINNRESLAPGGHYGAVLVTPTESGDSDKVQVNQVASALIFLKKQGGEVYNLTLRSYNIPKRFASLPEHVDLRFQNAGNVHVMPRGTVTMTDPMGKVVKKGFINAESGLVLPESFRQMKVPLESHSWRKLPGTYKVSIAYRYDGSDVLRTQTASFFYINGWYIVGSIFLLTFLIGIFVSKTLREWARGLIQKAMRPLWKGSRKLLKHKP